MDVEGDGDAGPASGDADIPDEPDPAVVGWDPSGLDLARSVMGEIAALSKTPRRTRARKRSTWETGDRTGGYSGAAPDDRDPQEIQTTVDRVVAERGWGTDLAVAGAVARWPEVVGQRVAEHAVAQSFTDGVLAVRAESTSWATEVRNLAPNILAALARELGDNRVTRLDVQGPDAPSWRHGGRRVHGRGPRDTYG